jgi:hypothetical protein
MQIKPEQWIVPVVSSGDWSSRIVLPALAGVIIIVLLAFTFQDRASSWFYSAEEAVGLAPSQQPFAATYRRLGISSLPPHLFAQDRVSKNLTRLSQEACDRQAIGSLANALAADGEQQAEADMSRARPPELSDNKKPRSNAPGLFTQARSISRADGAP